MATKISNVDQIKYKAKAGAVHAEHKKLRRQPNNIITIKRMAGGLAVACPLNIYSSGGSRITLLHTPYGRRYGRCLEASIQSFSRNKNPLCIHINYRDPGLAGLSSLSWCYRGVLDAGGATNTEGGRGGGRRGE